MDLSALTAVSPIDGRYGAKTTTMKKQVERLSTLIDRAGLTAIDFLKIDVEGMEIAVLGGLAETIARCRPVFFIEVDDVNNAAFMAWVAANDYEVAATYRRYKVNENFLLKPKKT